MNYWVSGESTFYVWKVPITVQTDVLNKFLTNSIHSIQPQIIYVPRDIVIDQDSWNTVNNIFFYLPGNGRIIFHGNITRNTHQFPKSNALYLDIYHRPIIADPNFYYTIEYSGLVHNMYLEVPSMYQENWNECTEHEVALYQNYFFILFYNGIHEPDINFSISS